MDRQIQKTCEQCSASFSVPPWRAKARFCTHACVCKANALPPNVKCEQCGVAYRQKPSRLKPGKALGNFCSVSCLSLFKAIAYRAEKNPNWKNKNIDSDGYRVYVPQSSRTIAGPALGRMKLHRAVACEALDIERIPPGLHVHHSDCDVLNNDPTNLVVMTASNHKWLHKQFGVATLWAVYHGRIAPEQVVDWSDDRLRAEWLLSSCLSIQALLGRFAAPAERAQYVAEATPVRVNFKVTEVFA